MLPSKGKCLVGAIIISESAHSRRWALLKDLSNNFIYIDIDILQAKSLYFKIESPFQSRAIILEGLAWSWRGTRRNGSQ